MNIAAAVNAIGRLLPAVTALKDAIAAKSEEWKKIVKIGRTHMQDATPLTLGQEWSGQAGTLGECVDRIEDALKGVSQLALGGDGSCHRHQCRPVDLIRQPRPRSPSSPNYLLWARRTNSRCKARTTRWFSYPVRCEPYMLCGYSSLRHPLSYLLAGVSSRTTFSEGRNV